MVTQENPTADSSKTVRQSSEIAKELREKFPEISADARPPRLKGIIYPCGKVSDYCWIMKDDSFLYIKDEVDETLFIEPADKEIDFFDTPLNKAKIAGGKEFYAFDEGTQLAIRM